VWPLARFVIATSGRAVLVRLVPLFGGIAIASTILFAGHGLNASDVIASMHRSLAARLTMWLVWLALATFPVSAAFAAPGTRVLRSLACTDRKSRVAIVGLLVILLAAAQAPVIVLCARGEDVASAFVAALLAVSLCASASSRNLVVFGFAGALVVIDRAPLSFLLAPPLACASVQHAWSSAFMGRSAIRIVRRSPKPIALALAYLARMIRSARARLHAAAVFVLAAGAALALSLRNDPDARPVQRALVVFAFPLSLACSLLVSPALETESLLLPLVRSTRTKALTLALAMALALAVPSTAFAATASTAAAVASHAPPEMIAACIAWSILIATAIGLWARRSRNARRSSTFMIGSIAIAATLTFMAASC
jgi:hypothetical protein